MTDLTTHANLVAVTGLTAVQLFADRSKVEDVLAKVRAEVEKHEPDISTKAGREAIASLAYKVARTKTALDGMGKDLVEDAKAKIKEVDRERKYLRDELDALKDKARAPLNRWEEREAGRHAEHKQVLQDIETLMHLAPEHSRHIGAMLDKLNVLQARNWEEYEDRAGDLVEKVYQWIKETEQTLLHREAEQAELARLRAEKEERERKEAEERLRREKAERDKRIAEAARLEAEQKAERERQQAEERHRLEQERAQREKEDAEQRAREAEIAAAERERQAVEAERRRQAEEAERERQETKRREANKRHKAAINRRAMDALVSEGVDAQTAKVVITAIASGKIPAIKISY